MEQLQVFNHENFGEVRTMQIEGEPWFVGKDVCNSFGDKNHNRSISRLDDDEKRTIEILDKMGRPQNAIIINESGLYGILFHMQPQKANNGGVQNAYPIEIQERIEQLRKFKRWVTSEVLPTIRKTGGYNSNKQFETLTTAMTSIATTVAKLASTVEALQKKQTPQPFLQPIEIVNKGFDLTNLRDPWGKTLTQKDVDTAQFWEALLFRWRYCREGVSGKKQLDEDFIKEVKKEYPNLAISDKTLYRKWSKYQKGGKAALVNYTGRHDNRPNRKRNVVITVEVKEGINEHVTS